MIQYLITALIDFTVGVLAFSKKENPAAKALAFTVFSLGAWSLELYFLTVIKNIDLLNILFHVARWGMFFIPFAFALLTWRLLGSRSQLFKKIFVIPGLVVSGGLSLINTFFLQSQLREVSGGYLPNVDLIYYLFFISFIWCFVGSIGLVAVSYKPSSNREKQKFKWLFITLFVSFIGGVLGMSFMPSGFYLSKFVGAITNIVFVVLLFYSTIQHNLMDIRLALSVSLIRMILLGFFVWLYFVFTSVVGNDAQSAGGVLVLLGFIVLILEAYPRLLRWILPNAKKVLLKNSYEFDLVKEDTEKALSNTVSFAVMSEVLSHLLLKILKVNHYKVLLLQPDAASDTDELTDTNLPALFGFIAENHPLVTYVAQKASLIMADEIPEAMRLEMEKHQATLCFTLVDNKKVLALMLVGAPSTLSYYRYDDIRMFEWLMRELGQVVNRLIRLDKMQDQLGEAKKTLSMLGMMSHYHHDIKAPFAIIDGVFSNNIYDRDKQKDIVLAQVERGSRLIATMASILGGKRRRRVQPCEIEALIKDCLFVFESSIDRVEYDLGLVPKVAGDAEDLKILFINLIKNAAEARRARQEIVLTVKTWLDEKGVFISVKDNGIGMNEKQLENLWDQGYSDKKFGSGIGMQAIKRIADEHGISVKVNSNLDVGTEFVLHFPLLAIDNETESETLDGEPVERRAANKMSNLKVN
jgi:signal transduction histidine kinase